MACESNDKCHNDDVKGGRCRYLATTARPGKPNRQKPGLSWPFLTLKSRINDFDMRKNLAINKLRPMTCTKGPCFRLFPRISTFFRIPRRGGGAVGHEWGVRTNSQHAQIKSHHKNHVASHLHHIHITLSHVKSTVHHLTSLLFLFFRLARVADQPDESTTLAGTSAIPPKQRGTTVSTVLTKPRTEKWRKSGFARSFQ